MTGSSHRIANPRHGMLPNAPSRHLAVSEAVASANEVAGSPFHRALQAASGLRRSTSSASRTLRHPVEGLTLLATAWLAVYLAVPTLASPPTTQLEDPEVARIAAEPATSIPATIPATSEVPARSPATTDDVTTDDAASTLLQSAEAAIQEAASPLDKSRIAINTAQQILVEQCAGPLSSWLAGAKPRAELARRAETAVYWLDRSAAFLDAGAQDAAAEQAHADEQDAAAEARWRIEDRIALLRAVAEMFLAIAHDDGSATAEQRMIDACGDLALYTTDANEALVESLNLWRGAAYRRAGRPERTLQVVRPIIAVPAAKRLGFLARVERCRALKATGNHVAGLSLCLRLNARVEAWLSNEGPNAAAQGADTLRFVRVELLRDWAAALRAEGQAERAAAAESQAQKLLADDPFPPPPPRWLQLDATIAGLSPLDAPRAQPTTQPAPD